MKDHQKYKKYICSFLAKSECTFTYHKNTNSRLVLIEILPESKVRNNFVLPLLYFLQNKIQCENAFIRISFLRFLVAH